MENQHRPAAPLEYLFEPVEQRGVVAGFKPGMYAGDVDPPAVAGTQVWHQPGKANRACPGGVALLLQLISPCVEGQIVALANLRKNRFQRGSRAHHSSSFLCNASSRLKYAASLSKVDSVSP